jgi:Prenyltransferase and squalene oxidase repeat
MIPSKKVGVSVLVIVIALAAVPEPLFARKSTGVPQYDAAVEKGIAFIRKAAADGSAFDTAGQVVLVAYAFLKAGEPVSDPLIANGINAALGRSGGSMYRPIGIYEHIYGAGIDAMLLVDASEDPEAHKSNLQVIANYIVSAQRADGSWSDGNQPGDVSMSQYGVLGLWAAQRAGCRVPGQAFDKAAQFLLANGNPDGGWGYRPGTTKGPGGGSSTQNMAVAGAGSIAIVRLLLHGQRVREKTKKVEKGPGGLEKIDPTAELGTNEPGAPAYPDYRSQVSAGALDQRTERALGWMTARFKPVQDVDHKIYFYYALERAASMYGEDKLGGRDWYRAYGDGLLSLQKADGGFDTFSGPAVGTSFAILYFMKSTQQILNKQYGVGIQRGDRGNPFGKDEKKREPTELDLLLADLEKMDFDKLDETPMEVADELIASVTSIDDPEKLIGEKDRLLRLLKHPLAKVRQPVVWALGRTGDFELVPLMLQSLRDVNVDVAVEAMMALRYIARKPNGFGLSTNPLDGAELGTDGEKLAAANRWRDKAFKTWSDWYFDLRPYEQQDGLDELEALISGDR